MCGLLINYRHCLHCSLSIFSDDGAELLCSSSNSPLKTGYHSLLCSGGGKLLLQPRDWSNIIQAALHILVDCSCRLSLCLRPVWWISPWWFYEHQCKMAAPVLPVELFWKCLRRMSQFPTFCQLISRLSQFPFFFLFSSFIEVHKVVLCGFFL